MEDKQKSKAHVAAEIKTVLRETPKRSYTPKAPQEGWEEEIGGREGPEPTRFGDWELAGKCVDF